MSNDIYKAPQADLGANTAIESYSYAGFWRRVGAYIIDCLVLALPIYGLLYLFNSLLASQYVYLEQAINIGLWCLYYTYCESSDMQATLGKKALNMKVIGADGNKLSPAKALFRYLGLFPAMMILFIGIIMIVFTEKKQGLHDKLVKAYVIVPS